MELKTQSVDLKGSQLLKAHLTNKGPETLNTEKKI